MYTYTHTYTCNCNIHMYTYTHAYIQIQIVMSEESINYKMGMSVCFINLPYFYLEYNVLPLKNTLYIVSYSLEVGVPNKVED